jgi:hypothetical protein
MSCFNHSKRIEIELRDRRDLIVAAVIQKNGHGRQPSSEISGCGKALDLPSAFTEEWRRG